jgi:hypothetical protein
VEISPVPRRRRSEARCTAWSFGSGPDIEPHPRAETPVSSGAVAFDLVRRESVWQRAGPPEGASPRTAARRSLVRQARVGRRITPVVLDPVAGRRARGTERPPRPSGRTGREPTSGSFPRNPNPTSVTG